MKVLKTALGIASGALLAVSAQAAVLISDVYDRVGPSETVVALFTNPATSTLNSYAGPVEVIVSGTGSWASYPSEVDAFYGISDGLPDHWQWYQLNLGWQGAPLFPLVGDARNIDNFISFIDGVGEVVGSAPAYNPSHVYHFVVDVPLVSGLLQFGFSDGNFTDNSGQYNIQIFQLQPVQEPVPQPVPEPAILWMLLASAGLAATFSRKRR